MSSKNLKRLFRKFDVLGHKLSQMNFTHPDYEEVSDDYDIMEDELEELGYEIPSGINPFKVDSGKIKDIETGKVVHVRENKQMKITKRQLRRIIREEKRRILNEIGPSRPIPNPEMKSPGQDTGGTTSSDYRQGLEAGRQASTGSACDILVGRRESSQHAPGGKS